MVLAFIASNLEVSFFFVFFVFYLIEAKNPKTKS